VLDVLLEFLKNNVHNQLQVKLHWQCLAIFHRVRALVLHLAFPHMMTIPPFSSWWAPSFSHRSTHLLVCAGFVLSEDQSPVPQALQVGPVVEADVPAVGICGAR
jgi:hypothetical protein